MSAGQCLNSIPLGCGKTACPVVEIVFGAIQQSNLRTPPVKAAKLGAPELRCKSEEGETSDEA